MTAREVLEACGARVTAKARANGPARVLRALEPLRVRGRRFPAGAIIVPPSKRGAALVEAGPAELVCDVVEASAVAFRVRLVKRWTSGRGRIYGPLQVVRVGLWELLERPAAVEVLEVLEGPAAAALPAEALPGRPPAKLARAVEWLTFELESAGGVVAVAEVKAKAGRARIKSRTLDRARAVLGASVVRRARATYWRAA